MTLTTAQRLAALETEVAQLRADMGPSGDFQRDGYLDNPVRIRLHEIGVAIDYCVALCSSVNERLDALGAGGVPVPPVIPPISGDLTGQMREILTDMGAVFASDGTFSGFKLITKGAPEGDYFGYVGVNDGALRLFAGIRESIRGAWMNRQVDKNPNLPVVMGPVVERDGAISWDWSPPIFGSDPNPNPFKTFLIYLAGFVRGIGPRKAAGPFLDFGTFEAGRGVRWFVRRAGSTTPDIDVALQMDSEGVALRIGGRLRRITLGPNGEVWAAELVDENQ